MLTLKEFKIGNQSIIKSEQDEVKSDPGAFQQPSQHYRYKGTSEK